MYSLLIYSARIWFMAVALGSNLEPINYPHCGFYLDRNYLTNTIFVNEFIWHMLFVICEKIDENGSQIDFQISFPEFKMPKLFGFLMSSSSGSCWIHSIHFPILKCSDRLTTFKFLKGVHFKGKGSEKVVLASLPSKPFDWRKFKSSLIHFFYRIL